MNAAQATRLKSRGQVALEKLFPAVVTIEGTNYECACSGLKSQANTLGLEGFTMPGDVVFTVRKELLTTRPVVGVLVTWNKQQFRVLDVPLIPSDPAWIVRCGNPNK